MKESITINLKKTMPLAARISEASGQIKNWLQSLGVEFSSEKHRLELFKCEPYDKEYRYHYLFTTRKSLSASAVSVRKEHYTADANAIPSSRLNMEKPTPDAHPDI